MSTPNGYPQTPSSQPRAALTSTAKAGMGIWLTLAGVGVFALIMIVVVDDLGSTWAMLPLVLISLLAVWWFSSGTVVVDDSGVRVYGGGTLKMLDVKDADIASAQAKDISPLEFGGWGLRISGAGAAFIIKRGPGLVVNRTKGAPRIYSVASTADAELMAARLNAQAARHTA